MSKKDKNSLKLPMNFTLNLKCLQDTISTERKKSKTHRISNENVSPLKRYGFSPDKKTKQFQQKSKNNTNKNGKKVTQKSRQSLMTTDKKNVKKQPQKKGCETQIKKRIINLKIATKKKSIENLKRMFKDYEHGSNRLSTSPIVFNHQFNSASNSKSKSKSRSRSKSCNKKLIFDDKKQRSKSALSTNTKINTARSVQKAKQKRKRQKSKSKQKLTSKECFFTERSDISPLKDSKGNNFSTLKTKRKTKDKESISNLKHYKSSMDSKSNSLKQRSTTQKSKKTQNSKIQKANTQNLYSLSNDRPFEIEDISSYRYEALNQKENLLMKKKKFIPMIKTEVSVSNKDEYFDEELFKKYQDSHQIDSESRGDAQFMSREQKNQQFQIVQEKGEKIQSSNVEIYDLSEFSREKPFIPYSRRNIELETQSIEKEEDYIVSIKKSNSESFEENIMKSVNQDHPQHQNENEESAMSPSSQEPKQQISIEQLNHQKVEEEKKKKSTFDEEGQSEILKDLNQANKKLDEFFEKQAEDQEQSYGYQKKDRIREEFSGFESVEVERSAIDDENFQKSNKSSKSNSFSEIQALRIQQQKKWKEMLCQLNSLKELRSPSKQKIQEMIKLTELNYQELEQKQYNPSKSCTSSFRPSNKSYELESPKIISDVMSRPRRSVEEQMQIVKSLSDKRLLHDLQFLDSLQVSKDHELFFNLDPINQKLDGEELPLVEVEMSLNRQTQHINSSKKDDIGENQAKQKPEAKKPSKMFLDFERQMDSYLIDSENLSKSNNVQNSLKKQESSSNPLQQVQGGQPSNDIDLKDPNNQRFSEEQRVRNQIVNHILQKLIYDFCVDFDKNKGMLHMFLFYISNVNIVLQTEQRQVDPTKFKEYLEKKVNSNNEYIDLLGKDLMNFISKNQDKVYEHEFLRNINRSFGLKPMKTLRWMRKAFQESEFDLYSENSSEVSEQQEEQIQAVLSPILLADFDTYKNQQVFEQINEEQYYLNHAVYACLNQIYDSFRPYGEAGHSVIPLYEPAYVKSLGEIEKKVLNKLQKVTEIRMGRSTFSPNEDPERIVNNSYKIMDRITVAEQHEKWSHRNMEDMVFESQYYMSQQIINLIFNQQVLTIFKTMNSYQD